MAAEIKTNDWVNVTVKSEPRTHGGRKTLLRMLGKDPDVRKERERMKKTRPRTEHQRGGRMWQDYPPHLRPTTVPAGTTFRVRASLDVLREMQSVAQYVELSPAQQ
jgi:hypothetical protein